MAFSPVERPPLSSSVQLVETRPDSASECVELVGTSEAVRRLRALVEQASHADRAVLIVAEPGEEVAVVARLIHARSGRANAPFLALDSAAATPADIERELFGTATVRRSRRGNGLETASSHSLLTRAAGGGLLLQNVGELAASTQARLARALRDGEVRLAGTSRVVHMTARLLATSGPGLTADVEEGRFRPDLYRRLSGMRIDLPPLRHRREDIASIALHLAAEIGLAVGRPIRFTPMALTLLSACPWRGNIAELRALLERVAFGGTDDVIRLEDLLAQVRLDGGPAPVVPSGNLRDARRRFERDYIAAVLQQHGGRIADAARALGIQRTNLYRKARQLGIHCGGTKDPQR